MTVTIAAFVMRRNFFFSLLNLKMSLKVKAANVQAHIFQSQYKHLISSKHFRFLSLVKPVTPFLPAVHKPLHKKTFFQKRLFTFIALCTFLILCQLPLYGIMRTDGADPMQWMRIMMASNRNTFMELGISPLVNASLIMQLLLGSKAIQYSDIDEDREDSKHFEKLLGFLIAIGEGSAYISSGMYGAPSEIGILNSFIILIQLLFTHTLIVLLDEAMHKGYGFGSATSLFIATKTCENILWKLFSPVTIDIGRGAEFEGALVALIHKLVTAVNASSGTEIWQQIYSALFYAFYRTNLTNMMNILCTGMMIAFIIYLEGWKIDIPITHKYIKNADGKYPIKLFYTSGTPVMLYTALVSNLYFFSKSAYKKFPENILVQMIGVWEEKVSDTRHETATSGLMYYISAPYSLHEAFSDIFRTLGYVLFMTISCAMFAVSWIEISGSSVKDVTSLLNKEDMMIRGFRNTSIRKELKRYIPIAATIGGILMALLTVVGDFTGVIGSGSGILLSVSTIYKYCEIFRKEDRSQKLKWF